MAAGPRIHPGRAAPALWPFHLLAHKCARLSLGVQPSNCFALAFEYLPCGRSARMWKTSNGRGSEGASRARRMAWPASSHETDIGKTPPDCGVAVSGSTKLE